MKKILKLLSNFIIGIISALLIIYIIGMQFYPNQLKELVGYQTFVVLTDSMEPTIPVGSLVLAKNVEEGQEIPDNTIVSFHVDRLGTEAIFTHYLRKKEIDETGRLRYYTQGETADRYDDYETYEEDILGTYVGHVPYVGKFVLFLQSPFALLELGIIGIITIIYNLLWAKFDREEKKKAILAGAEIQEGILPESVDQEEIQTIVATQEPETVQITEEMQEPETVQITEEMQEPETVQITEEVQELEAVQGAEEIRDVEAVQESEEIQESEAVQGPEEVQEAEVVQKAEAVRKAEEVQAPIEIQRTEEVRESEVVPEAEQSEPDKTFVFGYRFVPFCGAGETVRQGFCIDIYMDGSVQYESYPADGGGAATAEYIINKKAARKIKHILKQSAPDIREMPDILDNGFCVGDENLFKFGGRSIKACDIKYSKMKKVKRKSPSYYKKYHKNMEYENKVIKIFVQAGEVLEKEGIRLNLKSVTFELPEREK